MRRSIFLITILALFASFLSACSTSLSPASTVEEYLKALVAKDANRLSALSCSTWEADAQQILDSFAGVQSKLADLACKQTSVDGDNALVTCAGNIVATYNNEDMSFDLSASAYVLVKQNDEWLVCGTK